jgi:hypothetical protein
MAYVSFTPPRAPTFAARMRTWLAAWVKALKEVRAEAELRHKLRDVDDHMLRDMGLMWTGRRYERFVRREDERR